MGGLTIINHNGQKTIDSREVAEMVGKDHKNLLRDIRGYVEVLLSSDLSSVDFFIESTYADSTGRSLPCFLITRKGCDMVANKLTGEKGVLFSAAYINKFHEMESAAPRIPQTYHEALRLAADLAESNLMLTAKVAEDAPKVIFADSVSTSDDLILIGDLAKLARQNGVNVGSLRLFEWMRSNEYLIRRKGSDFNMPTQRSMDMSLFAVKETTINDGKGNIKLRRTTKVTGKGQVYFLNVLQKRKAEFA